MSYVHIADRGVVKGIVGDFRLPNTESINLVRKVTDICLCILLQTSYNIPAG